MTGDRAPDITVSIVSYNTCLLLRDCLQSLAARQHEGEASLEVVVADNDSTDGSGEMVQTEFPWVRLIKTGSNIGYGRANNLALSEAQGRYFFVLNSDTEVEPGALRAMRDFLDSRPEIGMVGARLLLPNGSTQPSCARDPSLSAVFWEQTYLHKLFPTNSIMGGYAMTDWDYASEREVEQIAGACMFMRREVCRLVGGFDTAYYMYFEDTDLCVRIRQAGWRIVFLPQARIMHHVGASSGDWRCRASMIASYNQSRYYYYTRYGGRLQGGTLKFLTILGASLRLISWSLFSLFRPKAKNQVRLFWDVWHRTITMTLHPYAGRELPMRQNLSRLFAKARAALDGVKWTVRAGEIARRKQLVPLDEVLRCRRRQGILTPPFFFTRSNSRKLKNKVLARILAADELGTWALDAKAINFLESEVARLQPSAIIEFGAGISTLCFACLMSVKAEPSQWPIIFSIEQNEWQISRTREQLTALGLENIVSLLHAPLVPFCLEGHEQETRCYALPPEIVREFLQGLQPDLVLIDGPAAEDGARYGTLRLVEEFLAEEAAFYMDDALRDSELDIAQRYASLPHVKIDGIFTHGKGVLAGRILRKPT